MHAKACKSAVLVSVIEEGDIKRRSDKHLWLFKHVDGRDDNLVCAAVVEGDAMIVKTVMINWALEDES